MSIQKAFLIFCIKISLTAALCPKFLKNQTACSCFAYIDGIVIKCNGPDGPAVVEQLKSSYLEVRELALENANIVEIGRNAFKNLRIKKLILDNNKIRALHRDAFSGLESVMQELSISMNRLTSIPTDSLNGMKALNVLNLKCNLIEDLEEVAFENLYSLIDLNLACNQICNISGPVFQNVQRTLQNLILDYNCFTSIPTEAIRGLDNLIGLHLKYNNIEQLENLQLMNVSSLAILTLTGNNINKIDANFMPGADNLRYLYMGNNNLTSLETESLEQFGKVQILDLSYNSLTEITESMFSTFEQLQHINLEGNLIKDIAPGAFATTPLLLLWLPNNCLTSISPNMFQGTPFLRQVSLANNNIRNIEPLSFAHLANLHTLDLSHNKIEVLESEAITGSDHLTVRLQENPMVCLQDGFHVMNGKEAINLTIEPNLICKTNYKEDTIDKCPKNIDQRASIPPCCNIIKSYKEMKRTEEAELTTAKVPFTTNEISSQDETTIKVTTKAKKNSKKINLERFLKLSQQPDINRMPIYSRRTNFIPVKSHMLSIYTPEPENIKMYRPIPSRIEQRQKLMAQTRSRLPPWIQTHSKNKDETVDFSSDTRVETVINDSSQ